MFPLRTSYPSQCDAQNSPQPISAYLYQSKLDKMHTAISFYPLSINLKSGMNLVNLEMKDQNARFEACSCIHLIIELVNHKVKSSEG
jgi:hypothetical protein